MSSPQSPAQDYETPVLQQDQAGAETHDYQTLETPTQQDKNLGSQGKNKTETHTYQFLEQSPARVVEGGEKDYEEFPLERKNKTESHVYQALKQQDKETKLYANQFELYGNDSGLYTSVTTSINSRRVHSASTSAPNGTGTGKQAPPRDYGYGAAKENSRVQDDNSKRVKVFNIALICCGLLAFVLVMGVAITALVLALNASNATCDCPEVDANLLFQQVDQIAELQDQIATNQERIEFNEHELVTQEKVLNFLREAAIELKSNFTQRIDKLAEEVGSIDTTVKNIILTKLGNCTSSIELSCKIEPVIILSILGSRCSVDYQKTDELVLDFSCSSPNRDANAVAVVSDNSISCECMVRDFTLETTSCLLSVTRCTV